MSEKRTTAGTQIPTELRELPIMKFLGDQIPEKMKTPEAKKTISRILFWGGLGALGIWFVKSLPSLIIMMDNMVEFGSKLILFAAVAIVAIVLIGLSPKIINFLHRIGNVMIFKGEKSFVSKNPIENLQLLARDVGKAVGEVDQKINEADGVRQNFVSDSSHLNDEADKKFLRVKGIYEEAQELAKQAKQFEEKGLNEKARSTKRESDEYYQSALMLKQEAEADRETSGMYAQYANQFGKAIEILKDNRSAAKMYLKATETSIRIIERKLDATNRMRNASEGIASAFNIKDSWVFQTAMAAAQEQISYNIATIRNNIQQLNRNNILTQGTASANRAELDLFIKQMENGEIKKLNVSEISSPGYELTDTDKVDKSFNILD